MIKYGLRIGDVGLEFSDRQSRSKAIDVFCQGSCVKISTYAGQRYTDHSGAFSTYERDSNEVLMNCSKCEGVFANAVCSARSVPERSYSGIFKDGGTEQKTLCDGCYAQWMKDYEIHKAKQTLQQQG